jgi:hypothetical protein
VSQQDPPPVKELSLSKATAMTSPHASTTEVVPAIATTAIDDNPPNQRELTAADDTEHGSGMMERETLSETLPPEENKAVQGVAGDAEQENTFEQTPNRTEDVTMLDGADGIQDAQAGLPPVTMAELAGMDMAAFNNPLLNEQPLGIYDAIDGLQFPRDPAEGLLALQMAMNSAVDNPPGLDPSPYIHELDEPRISAYAKLEFEDGEFYMNTHQVILGRDLAAARAAMRRDQEGKRIEQASGNEPHTPVHIKRDESRYTRSVISESGGILREGDDSDPETRMRRRKSRKASKKSKSTGSSSQNHSRRNSVVKPNGFIEYQAQSQVRRSAPETDGAVPVDPASLRPSPHDCPLVGIHPPAAIAASGYKAISRKHVKIAYNSNKLLFEAHIIGRNGAFVDDEFCFHNDVIPLKSGSRLQIGGVVVRFVLPDVAIGETGAEQKAEHEENTFPERYSEGGKEMSFDFEDAPRDGVALADTSDDSGDEEGNGNEEQEEDPGEDDEEEDDREDELLENSDVSGMEEVVGDERERETSGNSANLPDPIPRPEKKRGPGRPPKNGIMSKREQQLAKKEALALAQAQGQGQQQAQKSVPQPPGTAPTKNKVGRPRKHPRPDTPPIQKEKRKYTKRKPKEPKDPNVKQEGSGEDQPAKEKKERKERPPKPPRSPSPTFNEADLTPEQLAKPQANYVQLIFDALSNSPTGQMSLPQIYRAIMRKYPFFVLKTTTNGWQSSVRHNLSQHHAFRKVERDGKGWMWAIVDGISIEKEKKKKASPPPQLPPGHMHHQQILQAGHPPHMMQGHPYGPGIMGPPPGYPMNHMMHPNMHMGQPPQYMGPPHQMNGQPPPPASHPPVNGHPPPVYPASVPPQLAAPNTGTYSSPYAPKPNPTTATQSQSNEQGPSTEPRAPSQVATPVVTPHQHQSQQHPVPPQPPQQTLPPQQLQQPQPVQPQQPPPQQSQQSQQPQQSQQSQQARSNPPPRPAHPNEKVLRFLETFKTTVIKSLKEKTNNAEAIVNSAVNRTLGITDQSAVPGNTHEEMLITILRNSLSQIPESNIKPNPPQTGSAKSQPSDQRSAQTPQANHNEPQGNTTQQSVKSTGPEKSGPTVMRPSFTGQSQNRPNSTSVPRPPMMTPGIRRVNSGSPANAPPRSSAPPSSASPAPTPSTINGASTPVAAITDNGQLAGHKRPHDDADDMREFKRLSTSGLPQVKT